MLFLKIDISEALLQSVFTRISGTSVPDNKNFSNGLNFLDCLGE